MNEFDMVGMAGIMGLAVLLVLWILFVAVFVLWLWAMIDILKNEFTGSNKLIWLLVVMLLPFIGMVLYWLIGRDQKIKVDDEKV
jgi:uncharacterized RDD family membrane protein YckC